MVESLADMLVEWMVEKKAARKVADLVDYLVGLSAAHSADSKAA